MSTVYASGKLEPHVHHGVQEEALHAHEFSLFHGFHEKNVIHELKHYLPAQSAIKDFIHHNTLHAYQHQKFYDAIFKASAIFGYQVTLQLAEYRQLYKDGRISDDILDQILSSRKGVAKLPLWKEKLLSKAYNTNLRPKIGALRTHWKQHYALDMDSKVYPLLFRILSNYLDQGVSIRRFPVEEGGFLASMRKLESNGLVSFFKTKRAKTLLLNEQTNVTQLLKLLVGKAPYYEQYLFDQQFGHHGWSGFVSAIEDSTASMLDKRNISLRELILYELLLEIDTLDHTFGEGKWQPLTHVVHEPPVHLLENIANSELNEVLMLWQDAFEWSYYDGVLAGLQHTNAHTTTDVAPSFQAIFCIDERECSLRRHIENTDKYAETLGAPGFFGVEFYFQPENGKFYEKLCPAPVTPKYLIKENRTGAIRHHDLLYTEKSNTLIQGFFLTIGLGLWAMARTFLNLFKPTMSPAISNAFAHMNDQAQLTIENTRPENTENGLQIGFTVQEMATRVEAQLRGMGLLNRFAPVIYVVAHGSSSANNPHHGAHDCGACSGRARLRKCQSVCIYGQSSRSKSHSARQRDCNTFRNPICGCFARYRRRRNSVFRYQHTFSDQPTTSYRAQSCFRKITGPQCQRAISKICLHQHPYAHSKNQKSNQG